MGSKANPKSLRTGIIRDWESKYYPSDKKDWAKWLVEDDKLRKFLLKQERTWGISSIQIERISSEEVKIIINTSKPATVLGQNGEQVEKTAKDLQKLVKDKNRKFVIDVIEVKNPDLDAQLIANEIAEAIENRTSFRIAQKRAIRRVMRSGAKGIKTLVSGRLNGVEMARSEGYNEGVVPLQTFRNDIDYATATARTTYGAIGIKIWISKGEVLNGQNEVERNFKNRPQRPQRRNYDNNRKPQGNKPEAVAK